MLLNNRKGNRVKMNHGLNANRPWNNWVQGLRRKKWLATPPEELTISIMNNSFVSFKF